MQRQLLFFLTIMGLITTLVVVSPRTADAQAGLASTDGLVVLQTGCVVYDSTTATAVGIDGTFAANELRTIQVTGSLSGQGGSSDCLIPAAASSVVFTISAVDPQGVGNLRLSPQGVVATGGVVNYQNNGLDNANTVTVPLSANGQVDIVANNSATDLRLIAIAYHSPAGSLRYNSVTPCALADSRPQENPSGSFVGPFTNADAYPDIDVTDPFPAAQGGGNTACGIPTSADAILINLVAVRPTSGFGGKGTLAAHGTSVATPQGGFEATTPFGDLALNNAATTVVPIDDATGKIGVDVYGEIGAQSHVRVVALGYYDSSGDNFTAVTPCTAFDTRDGQGATTGFISQRYAGASTTYRVTGTIDPAQGGGGGDCGVPAGATAALINLVAIQTKAVGNFRAYATGTSPTGGILNFAPLTPAANNSNAVVVPLSPGGRFDLFTNAPANDGDRTVHARGVILGYLSPEAGPGWAQLGADLDGEAAGDLSGRSVDLSADGSTVAIGAIWNDGNGSNSGHVRVYAWNGNSWTQKGQDINGTRQSDWAGQAVSLSADGNTVAIGAPRNGDNGLGASGQARIFTFNGTSWVQKGQALTGENAGDFAGWSIAMSADGNTVALGATNHNSSTGRTRIFVWDGTSWVQQGQALDGEASGDRSGWAVALSADGNTLAIGARRNDGGGTDSGHTRVFVWNGTSWVQRGADIDGAAAGNNAGWAVAMSSDGDTVAVGSPVNNDSAGRADVYEWNGTAWVQQGSAITGEYASDNLGFSVALSDDGTTLALGVASSDGAGINAGHAEVFAWDGSEWNQRGRHVHGEALTNSSGYSVALSADGDTLAIGAPDNSGNGSESGHTRVFTWETGE